MKGESITIRGPEGSTFNAYLARPAKGSGPGIVLCQEVPGSNRDMHELADLLAEEGYVVMAPDLSRRLKTDGDPRGGTDAGTATSPAPGLDETAALRDIEAAVTALRAHPRFKGRVGAVGFSSGGTLAVLASAADLVDCAVSYCGIGLDGIVERAKRTGSPVVLHFGAEDHRVPPAVVDRVRNAIGRRPGAEIYVYAGAGQDFALKGRSSYQKQAADMAYSRTIALLRRVLGPHYDLSSLWEAHRRCEFETRDVDATMATMVAEPYVNHIPTMTGGYGYRELHRFYKHHFIPKSPKDIRNIPVSRTVGADRIVNEGVLCFTHDTEIDWMLPGVKPTGKYVEVPIVGIITFRGDKLVHEHIYWDQASVLVQIGLLEPAGLPVSGVESAKKVLEPGRPANTLMASWSKSARAEPAA
jgi:carboxymethylenebutenolidase